MKLTFLKLAMGCKIVIIQAISARVLSCSAFLFAIVLLMIVLSIIVLSIMVIILAFISTHRVAIDLTLRFIVKVPI